MPHRPNKSKKAGPAKKAGGPGVPTQADLLQAQQRRSASAKAIIGKFQGRKSI